ncbi:hypothetical protein [Nonomuraea longicatena]|uniref:Uncharacterized protein n=1 Tax=Nonomuraea longicatena TaxID=83682 RepID=A0ABN1QVV2_9ACTN
MTRTVRLLAAAAIAAGGLLLTTAPAHAIIPGLEPGALVGCVGESALGATAAIGAAGGAPLEIPVTSCLQP